MTSANPVSPKVIWAGIGSILGPLLLTIGQAFVDIVSSGSVVIPEPWDKYLIILASLVGAVIAAYAKRDPLRLPTIDDEAVKELESNS
jgi:hypothetical protein